MESYIEKAPDFVNNNIDEPRRNSNRDSINVDSDYYLDDDNLADYQENIVKDMIYLAIQLNHSIDKTDTSESNDNLNTHENMPPTTSRVIAKAAMEDLDTNLLKTESKSIPELETINNNTNKIDYPIQFNKAKRLSLGIMKRYFSSSSNGGSNNQESKESPKSLNNKNKFLTNIRTIKPIKSLTTQINSHLSIYEFNNQALKTRLTQRRTSSLMDPSPACLQNHDLNDVSSAANRRKNFKKSLSFFTQTIGKRFQRLKYNLFVQKRLNEQINNENSSMCSTSIATTRSECEQQLQLINEILTENNEQLDERISKSFDNINHLLIEHRYTNRKKKFRNSIKMSKSLDHSHLNQISNLPCAPPVIGPSPSKTPAAAVVVNAKKTSIKKNKRQSSIKIDAIEKLKSSLDSPSSPSTGSHKTKKKSTTQTPVFFTDYKAFSDCRTFEEKRNEINDFDLIYYLSTKSAKTRRNAICAKIDKCEYDKQLLNFMEYLLREDYIKNFLL